MELTLSRDCAIQTDLLTPDGQCLYTIFTPNKLTIKTTTITKHVLDEDGHTSQESIELARINWNPFGSSRLVYDGKIVDFSRLMPGEGMLNRVRCLAGPDGKAYKWRMGWLTSYLELVEGPGKPVVVARMQQPSLIKGRKPALIVDAAATHFLDLLVITWVFVEHKRRGGERDGKRWRRDRPRPVSVA